MSAQDVIVSGKPVDAHQGGGGGGGGGGKASYEIPTEAYARPPVESPETRYKTFPRVETAADVLIQPQIAFGEDNLAAKIAGLINDGVTPGEGESIFLSTNGPGLRAAQAGYIRLAFVKDSGEYKLEAAHSGNGALRRKIERLRSAQVYQAEDLGDISARCKLIGHIPSGKFILQVGQNELILGSVNQRDVIFTAGTHFIQSNQFQLKDITLSEVINAPEANLTAATRQVTDQQIDHNNCHRVQVGPGQFCLARIDNRYGVLEAGIHTFRHQINFEVTQPQPLGATQQKLKQFHRLYLRRNQVAALMINRRPEFIQGQDAAIYVGIAGEDVHLIPNGDYPFFDINTPIIKAGVLRRLFVPTNQVAHVTINGNSSFHEGTGAPIELGNDQVGVTIQIKSEGNPFYPNNEPVIAGNNCLRLFIPVNQLAAVVINGRGELIPGTGEAVYREGRAVRLLKKDDATPFYEANDPVIVAGQLTRLLVQRGQIATVLVNGVPQLIDGNGEAHIHGEGEERFQLVRKPGSAEPFYSASDAVIKIGNLVRLQIPAGQIATVRVDGQAEFIPGPITHELGKDKPVEFKPKNGPAEPFYNLTDPIIQLDNKVQLLVPPGKFLPCVIDGEPHFLTSADCTKFNQTTPTTFTVTHHGANGPFLDIEARETRNGRLTRIYARATEQVVVMQAGNPAILEHDDSLMKGVYVIDSTKCQLMGIVDMSQRELHIPSDDTVSRQRTAGLEDPNYARFSSRENVDIGIEGDIYFRPTDAIAVVQGLRDGIDQTVHDIVLGDLANAIRKTSYSAISGNSITGGGGGGGEADDAEEQGSAWQKALDSKTKADLARVGIELVQFRITKRKVLDRTIAEHLASQADQSIRQSVELSNQGVGSDLALAKAKLEQDLVRQAQAAEIAQRQEQQEAEIAQQELQRNALIAREQASQDAVIQRQEREFELEIKAAETQRRVAALRREAAEDNAKAQYAPEAQYAEMLQKHQALFELKMAQTRYEAEVAMSAQNLPLQTMREIFSDSLQQATRITAAANSGRPSLFAQRYEQQLTMTARTAAAQQLAGGGAAGLRLGDRDDE